MRDYSKTVSEIKGRLGRFAEKLSLGLSRPEQKFVGQILYGLLVRQRPLVSEIGRALREPVKLKKVHERLSRHLGKEGIGEVLQDNYLRQVAPQVRADSVIAVDVSEISKEYAKTMENLCWVRDGSDGKIKRGYWFCEAAAVEKGEVLPLYRHIYSSRAPAFTSAPAELFRCIEELRQALSGRGIYVLDRGADERRLYQFLLERGLRFVIRQKGDRCLITRQGRKKLRVRQLAEQVAWRYFTTFKLEHGGRGKSYHLRFGSRRVYLPQCPELLSLVVVGGFGQEPMMLLTNLERPQARQLRSVLQVYLARWKIEELLRHQKVQLQLEAIQVRRYACWQNLAVLVYLGGAFLCLLHHWRAQWKPLWEKLLQEARRIHRQIPRFLYYTLAAGLKALLSRSARGWPYRPLKCPADKQLYLVDLTLLEGLL